MNATATATNSESSKGRIDAYPSRTGALPRMQPRLDPVVYAHNFEDGPLSSKLVEEYDRRGFIVLDNLFSAAEIQLLQEELVRLRDDHARSGEETRIEEPGTDMLRSIFAIHASDSVFARLARDRRLVDIARFLLADEVYIHQSRLNCKPAFRGREFYWHSDFETWHVEDGMHSMRALSMSIALTPNSSNNGPLMVVPQSHSHYITCAGHTPEGHFRKSLRQQEYGTPCDDLLTQLVNEKGIETLDVQPGSVILFDCNTMHGSNSNITPYPRSNLFFVYNAISNRVGAPFCDRAPRPEFVCTRSSFEPLQSSTGPLVDE